jgi:hypothetical protein
MPRDSSIPVYPRPLGARPNRSNALRGPCRRVSTRPTAVSSPLPRTTGRRSRVTNHGPARQLLPRCAPTGTLLPPFSSCRYVPFLSQRGGYTPSRRFHFPPMYPDCVPRAHFCARFAHFLAITPFLATLAFLMGGGGGIPLLPRIEDQNEIQTCQPHTQPANLSHPTVRVDLPIRAA